MPGSKDDSKPDLSKPEEWFTGDGSAEPTADVPIGPPTDESPDSAKKLESFDLAPAVEPGAPQGVESSPLPPAEAEALAKMRVEAEDAAAMQADALDPYHTDRQRRMRAEAISLRKLVEQSVGLDVLGNSGLGQVEILLREICGRAVRPDGSPSITIDLNREEFAILVGAGYVRQGPDVDDHNPPAPRGWWLTGKVPVRVRVVTR